ncbi:MAG TPA: hypothetical protein VF487_20630 [Chitinophagaceae bacterium]
MKYFMYFINSVYWLWAFFVPVIITGTPAWLFYDSSSANLVYGIILLLIGIVAGIWFAERIRKSHGLSTYFSSLSETPDIDEKKEASE